MHVGIRTSLETMDHHLLELQRHWWLCRPIFEYQSHPQLHVNMLGWSVLVFLLILFSFAVSILVDSFFRASNFTLLYQPGLFLANTSQESTLILRSFISLLQTFLCLSLGGPLGLYPSASSPYIIFLGIRPSSILWTWLIHRN